MIPPEDTVTRQVTDLPPMVWVFVQLNAKVLSDELVAARLL